MTAIPVEDDAARLHHTAFVLREVHLNAILTVFANAPPEDRPALFMNFLHGFVAAAPVDRASALLALQCVSHLLVENTVHLFSTAATPTVQAPPPLDYIQ